VRDAVIVDAVIVEAVRTPVGRREGAEMIADRWGLARTQVDEYSVASHEKAAAAQDEGRFDARIAPVAVDGGAVLAKDEGIRRGTRVVALAGLRTVFRPEGGVITAGNSSQISDGSAALVLTTSDRARELGLRPVARVHSGARGRRPGGHADRPGPRDAQGARAQRPGDRRDRRVRGQRGVRSRAADVAGRPRGGATALNPNEGAIALGHPLGGSGARLMTPLVHHLRDNGIRYGLQTMCEGGGQANATILELLGERRPDAAHAVRDRPRGVP
jgi:acetyl-CoA acyltransferase